MKMAMGVYGKAGKSLMGPLLTVNLVMYMIVLGLSAWSLDKYINGQKNHPHLGGNTATSFLLMFSLLAGVIGACSVAAGLMHLRTWSSNSLAFAASLAIVSLVVTALAVGLVCKQIMLGGRRGKRLRTLEAFIVISVLSQLIYSVLLLLGSSEYGGTEISHHHQSRNSTTASVISM